ncbi:MAG: hypothetical protein J6Y84_04315 [Bacteroidaceae bacterium]|nr:hypothetical protein [Bacteroidaceae bacterium]
MKLFFIHILCAVCLILGVDDSCKNVLLEYIQHKSDIREGGSNVFNYEGQTYVISVASLTVGTKNEQNCQKVGAAKAKKEMLSFLNGSEISSYTELKISEVTESTLEGQQVEAQQEFTEIIKERVLGMINQITPLGGWYSEDKSVYYYAIYKTVDQ